MSSGFHDDGELGSDAASSRARSTRPVSRYARRRRTARAGSSRARPLSICSVHVTRNCASSAAASRSSSCVTASIGTPSTPGGWERRESDMPGGGALVRVAAPGGTLPRDGGGTLGRAGGGWLRAGAGIGGEAGGGPDGGGMVGKNARRAIPAIILEKTQEWPVGCWKSVRKSPEPTPRHHVLRRKPPPCAFRGPSEWADPGPARR
jgi:hypothetical protein